jgi:CRISPR/Cas system CSM-associated protein Csm2 small subunit
VRTQLFRGSNCYSELKTYKSPGINQIPAELIQAGGNTLRSEIRKLFNSVWNKEELPQKWKESITAPIYKMVIKANYSNYRGISVLTTTYKILSNILFSRLISHPA